MILFYLINYKYLRHEIEIIILKILYLNDKNFLKKIFNLGIILLYTFGG